MAVLMIDIESGINIAKMEMRKNGPNTHRKREQLRRNQGYLSNNKKEDITRKYRDIR